MVFHNGCDGFGPNIYKQLAICISQNGMSGLKTVKVLQLFSETAHILSLCYALEKLNMSNFEAKYMLIT